MRDPAGLSMPSGVPEMSRMETGMSTVEPLALALPTVTTSCATAGSAITVNKKRARGSFIRGRLQPHPKSNYEECHGQQRHDPFIHRGNRNRNDIDRAVDECEISIAARFFCRAA